MTRSGPSAARLGRRRREGAIDLLFLVPTLVILAAFLLYPLLYGLVLSVHDTHGFDLTSFVGLDHYAHAVFGDAVFHRSLLNTVLFTSVAVVLQTGLGLLLAVLVAGVRRGRTVFVFVFFAPFVLAPVAVGTVWKFLFAPFFGIVPTLGGTIPKNGANRNFQTVPTATGASTKGAKNTNTNTVRPRRTPDDLERESEPNTRLEHDRHAPVNSTVFSRLRWNTASPKTACA